MSTLADSSQKPRLKNLGLAEDFPIPCSQRRVRNLVILTFDVSTCNHGGLRVSPNSQCHAPGHKAWFRDYYEFLNHSPEIRQGLMSWCRGVEPLNYYDVRCCFSADSIEALLLRFEAFFKKDLARRLLLQRSCREMEHFAATLLREECGGAYTAGRPF